MKKMLLVLPFWYFLVFSAAKNKPPTVQQFGPFATAEECFTIQTDLKSFYNFESPACWSDNPSDVSDATTNE